MRARFSRLAGDVTVIAGDVVNFRPVQKAALALRTLLTGTSTQQPGVRIAAAPATLKAGQRAAIEILTSGQGESRSPQAAGIAADNLSSGVAAAPVTEHAAKITQITYGLVRHGGANSAVVGGSGWANTANAAGARNGTVATFTGNVAAIRNGFITLGYADPSGKDELAISRVELIFYFRIAGAIAGAAIVQLRYAHDGVNYTTVETRTSNEDHLVAGHVLDVTADRAWTWAMLALLTTRVTAISDIGETWTCDLDAVEVRITASKTDVL